MDLALDQLEKYSNSKLKLTLVKKREYIEVVTQNLTKEECTKQ